MEEDTEEGICIEEDLPQDIDVDINMLINCKINCKILQKPFQDVQHAKVQFILNQILIINLACLFLLILNC